ncbi:putative Dephospho-CoA kinase domain-containing protein [Hypsibius exemplaris]|uniref:Dephospho-CoA kinase domain-containing protein n=1 Tax=Hypsibius exemplaris TaxID=2072580 RepID=A0A1W0XB74_HYPEX|nr:putative Dephospho-CoA kinase domain-containing protein [Hypsibius exemplaris]
MFLVGLTGSVGTGKSTVSQVLLSLGVPIIDADAIARDVVVPNTSAWKKLRASPDFGPVYFHEDGELNRDAVAQKVFNDPEARRQLEAIVHPEIRMEMIRRIIRLALHGHSFVILDVPLLYEKSPLLPFCHKVVVVTCSRAKQIERLKRRTRWSEEEILSRIAAQLPVEEKAKRADIVIDNNGTIDNTERQINKVYRSLQASRFHWIVRLVFLTGVLFLLLLFGGLVAFFRWIL